MKSSPTLRPVSQNSKESKITTAKATPLSQDRNQTMTICKSAPTRNLAWLILLSLTLALQFSAGMATAQAAATVTTDQGDYPPGATARIYGGGFLPGEVVELIVLHADGISDGGEDHQPW